MRLRWDATHDIVGSSWKMAGEQQWQLGPQDHQQLTELFPIYFPVEEEQGQTPTMSRPEVQEAPGGLEMGLRVEGLGFKA